MPATIGPVLPLNLSDDLSSEQVDTEIENFIETTLKPVEDNVTFILPAATTEQEKNLFDEHIDTLNPAYQSCVLKDDMEDCNDTFIIISLVDEITELIDLEETVDVPVSPICIGKPFVMPAPEPVLEVPSIKNLTSENVLPSDLCDDFDSMLQSNHENTIFVFFPNQMVDFDAANQMINNIFDLTSSVKLFVYHFNTEFIINSKTEVGQQMRLFYNNMIQMRTEQLPDNSLELLDNVKANSIVVNVQGTDDQLTKFQSSLVKKVHCIQQRYFFSEFEYKLNNVRNCRNINLIEITTTTIAEYSTTPAPVTLSEECRQSCPEASFLLDSQCPVGCVALDDQPTKCHKQSEVVKLRPPRGLRHCFVLGVNKYTKTTCSGVCEQCENEIDLYTGKLEGSCKACRPSKTTPHKMRLRCPDGSEPTAQYYTVDECACS